MKEISQIPHKKAKFMQCAKFVPTHIFGNCSKITFIKKQLKRKLLLAKVNFTLSPGTDSLIIYPAFTAHKKSSKSDSKLKFTKIC